MRPLTIIMTSIILAGSALSGIALAADAAPKTEKELEHNWEQFAYQTCEKTMLPESEPFEMCTRGEVERCRNAWGDSVKKGDAKAEKVCLPEAKK